MELKVITKHTPQLCTFLFCDCFCLFLSMSQTFHIQTNVITISELECEVKTPNRKIVVTLQFLCVIITQAKSMAGIRLSVCSGFVLNCKETLKLGSISYSSDCTCCYCSEPCIKQVNSQNLWASKH